MLNFGGFIQFVQSGVRGSFGMLRWRYWQEPVPCASSKNSVCNVPTGTGEIIIICYFIKGMYSD